eukprot:270581_1
MNTLTGISMNGNKCKLAILNIKYINPIDKLFIDEYYSDNKYDNDTNPNHGIFINNKRLKRVYDMKILGVTMSFTIRGDYNFNNHVKLKIETSTNQLNALLLNGLNYQITNISMRKLIYVSIIQSNVLYG